MIDHNHACLITLVNTCAAVIDLLRTDIMPECLGASSEEKVLKRWQRTIKARYLDLDTDPALLKKAGMDKIANRLEQVQRFKANHIGHWGCTDNWALIQYVRGDLGVAPWFRRTEHWEQIPTGKVVKSKLNTWQWAHVGGSPHVGMYVLQRTGD